MSGRALGEKTRRPAPPRGGRKGSARRVDPSAKAEKADGELLELARRVLSEEARAIEQAGMQVNGDLVRAARLIGACEGRLVVAGMGKANFVAQKVSATFASTGTPSLFLHPADALHGDLGRLASRDVLLAFSHSGETEEMTRLVGPVKAMGAAVLAVTASKTSGLGRAADLTIEMGRWEEAGSGLAPTTSTTVMMALGDALATVVVELRGFTAEDFHQYHPGGALGRRLTRVQAVMRTGDRLPIVRRGARLSEVIAVMTGTRGRPGAAVVVDARGKLAGIFTDGDLRRLAEARQLDLETRVESVMGRQPKTVRADQLVIEAADVLRAYEIDQVPVVDGASRPVGLLDVQDLLMLRFL